MKVEMLPFKRMIVVMMMMMMMSVILVLVALEVHGGRTAAKPMTRKTRGLAAVQKRKQEGTTRGNADCGRKGRSILGGETCHGRGVKCGRRG